VTGLRPGGKKEVIGFRLAARESAAEWEKFRTSLPSPRQSAIGPGKFHPDLHLDCPRRWFCPFARRENPRDIKHRRRA
jgi:hypothetical protein